MDTALRLRQSRTIASIRNASYLSVYERPGSSGFSAMSHDPIVIVSYARTPIGSFQGAFASLKATDRGAVAVTAAVQRSGVDPSLVESVIMGCVLPAGLGQAPARQAALGAGLPLGVEATTVNKMCGSGMQAAIMAHDALMAGSNDIIIAGGMESMTNAPYALPKHRGGARIGHDRIIDMAEATATRAAPGAAAASSSAQARMRAASPMLVPPNLCTSMRPIWLLQCRIISRVLARRHEGRVGCPARRFGHRLNLSPRRCRCEPWPCPRERSPARARRARRRRSRGCGGTGRDR